MALEKKEKGEEKEGLEERLDMEDLQEPSSTKEELYVMVTKR